MDINNIKFKHLKKLVEIDQSKGGRKPHYSFKSKELIRELYKDGVKVSVLKNLTGITDKSIRIWVGLGKASKSSLKKFKPLSVASEETFELIFPNGMRVHGLSIKQLMEFAVYATAS